MKGFVAHSTCAPEAMSGFEHSETRCFAPGRPGPSLVLQFQTLPDAGRDSCWQLQTDIPPGVEPQEKGTTVARSWRDRSSLGCTLDGSFG